VAPLFVLVTSLFVLAASPIVLGGFPIVRAIGVSTRERSP
jgi:hypothetical protein